MKKLRISSYKTASISALVQAFLSVLLCIGAVVSAFVPILLLRYNSIKYLFSFLLLSILFYVIILFLVVIFLIGGSFDFINYATFPFPIGFGAGTVIAIIINTIKNKKENLNTQN